nr:unnamed protein product [Digitaria exilis]
MSLADSGLPCSGTKKACAPSDSKHRSSPRHPLPRTASQYAYPLGALGSSDAMETSILCPARFARLGAPAAIGLILGSSSPPFAAAPGKMTAHLSLLFVPAAMAMLWAMLAPALTPERKTRPRSPWSVSHGSSPDATHLRAAQESS